MSESKYLNRELGWLQFNKRVLNLAKSDRTPLLEKVNFLNIFHSNMDEFFMKRVGGLKRQHLSKFSNYTTEGMTAEEQLKLIRQNVIELHQDANSFITQNLVPALEKEGVYLLTYSTINESEKKWVNDFFRTKLFPVLTPMAVDQGHPFPLISNLSLSLAVSLKHPKQDEILFARIKVPKLFPTWILIEDNANSKEQKYISLADVVYQNLQLLFPNMEIQNTLTFRVTRNIDISSDDYDDIEDLMEAIVEEVKQRKFADIVRLEHDPNPDPWLLEFLKDEFDIKNEDIYEYPSNLELHDLSVITKLNRPTLKYPTWTPVAPTILADEENNIFNVIKNQDILVQHPYESFAVSVERFIQTAATDPTVMAIKMVLYRTNSDSNIVKALIRAAESGKHVVCLVELKARLDEERNIYWAQAMEDAGVHVVYGIVGLKTHAKVALVIRHEGQEFKSYAHIGTGNYHAITSRLYTDFGLLTANTEITTELIELFHYLTGRSLKTDYKKLLVAPINLKSRTLELIQREMEHAKSGKPAEIIAKVNSLGEQDVIDALYAASQAGVNIKLIVRGFSCLRPGVLGLSENISLISVLGQFLEHSRIFYFRNGKDNVLDGDFFIGSADWLRRNLSSRVEVVVPIETLSHRAQIWETLTIMLNDHISAWQMRSDGTYELRSSDVPVTLSSQEQLMETAKKRG